MARKPSESVFSNVACIQSTVSGKWRVGAYLRLSKEDAERSSNESAPSKESNECFRRMLEQYAKMHLSSYSEFSGSIINQWKRIDTFLNDNILELELVRVYIDDGLSGATDDRVDFQNMIEDCKDKRINCIVVPDSSRFARNYADCEYYVEDFFKVHSTRFIALGSPHVDSVKDPSSVSGMQFHFTNYFNEFFLKQTSDKIRSTFNDKRIRGEYIGSFSPYGYKKDPDNKNKLIVDEDAAEIVRKCFDLFVNKGYSIRQICIEFNKMGIPSILQYMRANGSKIVPNKKPRIYAWNYRALRKLLSEEKYCGHMIQGKSAKVSYKNKKLIDKPKEEWVVVRNTHEAIIEEELFQKAQTLLERPTRVSPTGERSRYSGFMYCGKCGYAMNRKRTGRSKVCGEYGYVCRFYQSTKQCEPLHITEDSLDERVLYAIRSQIALLSEMEDVYSRIIVSKNYADESKILQSSLDKLEKQLKTLESKTHRLYDSYDEGTISKELYTSRSKALEDEISDVKEKIAKVQKEIRQYKDVKETTSGYFETFKKYETVTEVDRELLVALVDKIFVENLYDLPRRHNLRPKKVTIVFKFQDEYSMLERFIAENKLVNF